MRLKATPAAALRQMLAENLAVPNYKAGRCFGMGRKKTDEAVAAGALPVIAGMPGEPVPTEWLRRKLQVES
jgi:hypothetical protein